MYMNMAKNVFRRHNRITSVEADMKELFWAGQESIRREREREYKLFDQSFKGPP